MDLKQYEEKMKETIEYLEDTFSEIRAGRANPNILNKINVEYYGTLTPVNQIAAISVPEAKQILIQPWDMSSLKMIEKAIIEANIGVTPQNDGKCVRLIFPDLTEERRREITKDIKEEAENAKVSIRNIRRDAMDDVKQEEKASNISEDEKKRLEDNIQDLTDKYVKKIDEIFSNKEKEVMTV